MAHQVTAMKVQKRNHQRVNVYLDEEFAFGLARIVAAWLHVGQVLSDEKIAQLRNEDELETAYQRSLKYVNNRPHSEAEVRRHLQGLQVSETITQSVVSRLRDIGLVNDSSFAQNWVENRGEFRPRSKRALAFEMHRRGLNEESITQALASVDDEKMAIQAALKQARKLRELEWPSFRQKLSSFLARRGFSYEVIQPVVVRIWNEITDRPDSEADILDKNEG
jgi:regulatory protein